MTDVLSPIDTVGSALRSLPSWPGKARAVRLGASLLPASWCVRRVPDPAGFDYLVDLRSRTEAGAFANRQVDFVAPVLGALMKPGSVVLDVGANVGLIALPLAARARVLGGGARVLAFEPVPANFGRLTEAIVLNGLDAVASVVNVGLAAQDDAASMVVDAGAPTGNAYLRGDVERGTTVSVVLRRLDDVVAEQLREDERVDLIKLDVEGAEVGVLQGASTVLATHRPVILGEFNSGLMPAFGTTFLDAAEILGAAGYSPYAFDSDGKIVTIVPEVGRGDVLWVPNERIPSVTAVLPSR